MVRRNLDRYQAELDMLSTETLGQIRPCWQRPAEFYAAAGTHGVYMQRSR
jgi:hypothetical protein